jgi:hypothetical protein
MKRWLYGLVMGLLLAPMGAAAHGGFEHVMGFGSQVSVSRQNVVTIKETIIYDFNTESKHGIYRTIPTRYDASEGKHYQLNFKFNDATLNGSTVPTDIDDDGKSVSMRLGDPDKTTTGIQTYVLSYELSPVVTQVDGKDLLTLDVVGTGWEVPVEKASVQISLEDGAQLSDSHCFVGEQGATNQDCQSLAGASAGYTASGLGIGEGMTVTANLPTGYVSTYLLPRSASLGDWIGLMVLAAAALAAALVVFVLIARAWRARRRRKSQTVIAQYEPPKGMTPAEVGLLQDDTAAVREVTATLIDLAIRGYLKIIQTKPKRWYRQASYRLELLKGYDDVADYEQTLLAAIFHKGKSNIELSKVDRTATAAAVQKMNKTLKQHLKDRDLYGKSANQKGLLDKAVDTGTITDAGAKVWSHVEGFKLYLSVVEKDRLKFTDAPAKTPERFNKLLPYAIALGVEKEWAQQFEGIDVAPQSNWYAGSYAGWTALALASDLSSGFSSSVGSSFVSTSGGASGGSAGGGFGGGGGGSW